MDTSSQPRSDRQPWSGDAAPPRPCCHLHELAAAAASFNTCFLSSVSDHRIWQHNVSSLSCLHILKQQSVRKLLSGCVWVGKRGHLVSKQAVQEAPRAHEHPFLLRDTAQSQAP